MTPVENPVRLGGPGLALGLTTAAIAVIAIASGDDGWMPVLDGANLAFHEAGHLIFGIFGETPGLYGGTLGQLVFPVTAIVLFWRRADLTGMALGLVWFFENWLNIAVYMADARKQALPLVGGGEHDWWNIFTRWDALTQDTAIAAFVQFCGWMGLIATWCWVGWRWLSREKKTASGASG